MNNKEKFSIIDKPYDTIHGKERTNLVDTLLTIARNGFGTEVTRDDVENHVLKVDKLYLASLDDKVIGFSSYNMFDIDSKNILYLNGIVVLRDHQKNGLFYKINNDILSKDNYDYLVMRTQNPVIYAATQKIVKEIYPNGKAAPEDIKSIARKTAIDYLKMKDFDEETFVGRNTYGVCMYDKVPHHSRGDNLFNDKLKLNYESGDTILIVGTLNDAVKRL
jgi:hypothetical protein